MQFRIQQAADKDGSLQGVGDLTELTSKFDFLTKGLTSGAEMQRAQRDMQVQHESEIQTMQMSLKKLEKEIGYKDEEVRHYKNMASQAAENYEKCERTIGNLEKKLIDKEKENERVEGRIVELEVRIGKLNTEKFQLCQEFESNEREKSELNRTIEDLNLTIQSLTRDMEHNKAEHDEREQAMKQMQETLMKKAEQNQRLSETVNNIKN